MSGQGSSRLLAKRENTSLAEVDLINSNQFKHDQQKLQRHQAKLRKDYIETMLVHNREYSELKQFLHCIKQVSKEDDDTSVKSVQRPLGANQKKCIKGKSKKRHKDVDDDDDSDDEDDDDDEDSDGSADDNQDQAKKMDKSSQEVDSKKANIYLTRPNGMVRVNINQKSKDDKLVPGKTKAVQPRLTSREQIDNSSALSDISESTRKTTARLTALNLNAMREQFQRISSPLPPNNLEPNTGAMVGSNLRASSPRFQNHNTLFPTNNQRMGASSPFHIKQNGDRPSSRRESSAFGASVSHFTLSAPRRSSAVPPHSSFYPRPQSGMSDADFGSPKVSSSFPGAQRPSLSRETVTGEGSVSSSARSSSRRAPVPPKIGTKALQVLVASQKKILERRKSGENLSTRLMTPSECIEMQNRRRALLRISEDKRNSIPPNTPRIGPKKLSSYDKSKSF